MGFAREIHPAIILLLYVSNTLTSSTSKLKIWFILITPIGYDSLSILIGPESIQVNQNVDNSFTVSAATFKQILYFCKR